MTIRYVVLFSALPMTAFALDADQSSCHALSENAARLACYDTRSGFVAPTGETETLSNADLPTIDKETPQGKQWIYSDETSALNGTKSVWLSVTSENKEPNSIGSPIYATLWVRCMENSTNLLIGFDRYTSDDQSVKYRLDHGSVKSQWMETMRGGDGIGIWSGGRAIPLIKEMFGKSEMVFAYKTYTSGVEFKFDISGLRARIEPLAEACGWTP